MIEIVTALLVLLLLLILWFYLFPIRYVGDAKESKRLVEPPDFFLYSYVLHIHTQFSYDSLGKPEDVIRARDELGIDYAIVTDHDNDSIRNFSDERLIAGREIKLNDERGKLLGDLLEVGDVKIIAHHFRGKYRWRLEKRSDYFLELIDLRDALLENKLRLFLYLLVSLLLYPILGNRIVKNFSKLIDPERYVRRYFEEGWRSKVVGGLDHHVKLYFREIGKRLLIPDYKLSMSLLRNFMISEMEIRSKEYFLKALRDGVNVISFSEKPSLVWNDGNVIKVYSPFQNTLSVVCTPVGRVGKFLGSCAEIDKLETDRCMVVGYTYAFRVGKLLFGIKPLFVSDILRLGYEGSGETSPGLGEGKNTPESSEQGTC